MKTFLSIFLCAIGIFSANQIKAQIITISAYGRTENRVIGNPNHHKLDAEKPPARIKEKIANTYVKTIPVAARRFYAPLKNMTATSGYGWRRHPVIGGRKFHSGIDLKAWYEPVYAVADGIIKKAAWGDLEGYYIVMVHGSAETIYCHLSKLLCSPGDTLKGGRVLGISGNTGRSTGPHLHFGMKYNGLEVNPKGLLKVVDL